MSDETKNETVNVSVNNAVLPKDEKATKLEVIITVLLGVATVLGALAAYFAALWGGNQQSSYAQSISEEISSQAMLNLSVKLTTQIQFTWKL